MGKKIQLIGRYALEGQLLGKGSFARVELAHHTVTGCKVAIKIIDTRKLKEEYQKNNLHREARILGQLRHPNIIRLYETLKATTLHCLVLEYASGGELQHFIKSQKDFRLSEDRSRPYVRQLVSALHYLHERGVAHRDIKMENIMLDTQKTNVKLIDFGLSNTFAKDELMKTHCGSPEYAAPELFTAGEKYGLEIDVWSLGIVMYAIMVGKLPFTTPYTDQYRRQKLVQQMEKGLVDAHNLEMGHLSTDCQDLLHKIIEPCPSLRLSLLDMEIHPWFTEQAKKPFYPFQSFPRDKMMKTQTYDELAVALSMRKEVLEQKVAENKCDELSAMFNMILDKKRLQQGLFDVDHTIKGSEKKETKGKRSKSAHAKNEKSADKKHVHKGPPALILPTDDNAAESAPNSGNEAEHETKFSSFDFLALCSTPTWLGPERRKSRRRSRSPMPSPHVLQHGSQGDYLERQAMELEREMIREERAAAAGLLSPTQDSRQQTCYNDHHIPVTTSLSVPGSDSASTNHSAFRRSSSFKLSRRRARSCGPSQRRKSSFQRSGSVDHHSSDKEGGSNAPMFTSIRDGRSAPAISGDGALHRGSTKTASLKMRRNSAAGSHHIVASRKQSVDFVDTVRKSLLGVPNYDVHKNNLLTVPLQGSNNSLLKTSQLGIDSKNLLQVPNLEMGSNPLLCVPNLDILNNSIDDTQLSPNGVRGQSATRPGKLVLKECYPPPVENSKLSSHLLPLLKPLISGPNGPLTSVEVHYADSSNPSSSADLLQTSSQVKKDAIEIQQNDKHNLKHLHKHDYFSLDVANKPSLEDSLFDLKSDKKYLKHSKIESTSATSLTPQPRSLPSHSKSTNLNANSHLDKRATTMQFDDKSRGLGNASDNNVLLGAEGPVVHRKDSITDLEHHFDGLLLSSECLEENEDHVDSMTELISNTFREDILANAKPSITSSIVLSDSQKVHRQNSAATPDDERIMKRAGSVASFSKTSSSGRKTGGGKAKSPTTPTWLNLRTPLARIESFHSDDFECFADSDNDDHDSNSSMSATTPTVPCFAYKLHVMKKKQTKLKSSGNGKQSGCGCGSKQNSEYLSSKLNRNSVDKKHASMTSGHTRLDAAVTDPLLSSGSETEQHDEGQERLRAPGQSKIHPMGTDDRDAESLSKPDAQCFSYHNAITKQPNQIKNAVNRLPRIIPEVEQGAKKRAFVKHLAWRKSFAQFLKRKRYHSPLLTAPQKQQNQLIHRHHQQNQQLHQHHHHQQQPSPSNNNNNDLALSDAIPESRNGISALSQLQTKALDISTVNEDIMVNSQEGDSFKLAASTLSTVPVETIVTELIELQTSPKLQCPTSPSQAFDFTMTTDSPKMKSSCLLGWGTCRECGSEDISSDEENDYIASGDPTTVMLNLKPLGENNVHESMNCSQIYQLSST